MSLHIEIENKIPAETIRVAQASFGKKNRLVILRDEFGPLFKPSDFADLYSWKGSEGIAPDLLATVTVLQYAEKLSDSQAVGMVSSRIDWKYLLGVELDYAGFDSSVLSEFRERLVANEASERLFELPLMQMKEQGLVQERGKQRTDSSHALAAIRTLNRLELVGETLRHTLNQLAIVAPTWLMGWMPNAWLERYSSRSEEAKFPQEENHIEIVGPMRPDSSPQAKQQAGYDLAHFLVDYSSQTVTCPQGHTSVVWSPSTNKAGVESITVRFAKHDCADCPANALCTSSLPPRNIKPFNKPDSTNSRLTLSNAITSAPALKAPFPWPFAPLPSGALAFLARPKPNFSISPPEPPSTFPV